MQRVMSTCAGFGRTLGHIAAMARVLDATTVLVGMRPAVAITPVEPGMSLKGIRTALDTDKGMDLLRKSRDDAADETGESS
jgi:rsbT antagonist protein RsbS